MSTTVRLWCHCGGSLVVSSTPGSVASRIAASFRSIHTDENCAVTDDPVMGRRVVRKWRQEDRVLAKQRDQ